MDILLFVFLAKTMFGYMMATEAFLLICALTQLWFWTMEEN
jgi:hypothetical protein